MEIVINFRLIALLKGGNMKAILLSTMLIAIIILVNCSGDRAVKDPLIADDAITNSLNMTEDPGAQYPPEYGDNEFTLPFTIIMSYLFTGDTCGSNCELMVGAILLDYYGRSYPYSGIEVNFEVTPESIAVINHTSYTNENGEAATKLVYSAFYAFQEVVVIASCGAIADTGTIVLPICHPHLELSADPERLWVEQPGAYDTTLIAFRLTDNYENPIGGGLIVFTPLVAGEICGPTWVYTGDHGWASTHYRISYDDIPDGNNDPHFIETGVRATLFGYPDAEVVTSICCARP
jgi:hypothetical protein